MGGSGKWDTGPFRHQLELWAWTGCDDNGVPSGPPAELEQARVIDALCQRYSCLPSQLLNEDVGMLRMLAMVTLAEEVGANSGG